MPVKEARRNQGRSRIVRAALLLAGLTCLLAPHGWAAQASDASDTCLACHGEKDLTTKHGNKTVSLFVDGKHFAKSVHAALSCTGCHSDLEGKDIPHPTPAKVNCSTCHIEEQGHYEKSAHGKASAHGNQRAPACVSCHGNHDIVPVKDAHSAVSRRNAASLCTTCHNQGQAALKNAKLSPHDVSKNYPDTIHGEGLAKRGLTLGPTCISCHKAHDVMSPGDAHSSTGRARIMSACGQCHSHLEVVHQKVIRAEVWKNKSTIPACLDCHQPHPARQEAYGDERADTKCLSCHNNPDLKSRDGHSMFVNVVDLGSSRHAKLTCNDCHSDIMPSHAQGGKTVAGKVDCASCHADPGQRYQHSIHGQLLARGDANAPSCADCHGTHHVMGKQQPESPTFASNVPDLCARCHREGEKAAMRYHGAEHQIIGRYSESIHGKGLLKSGLTVTATCTSCHTPHSELPASDPASTVNPKNVPSTCGTCHHGIEEKFSHSVHSASVTQTDKRLPVCSDCHTAHSIQRADQDRFKLEIMNTCGQCHSEVAATYFDTYHGKVSRLGYTTIAKCYDCHGSHEIRKVRDPQSTLSSANRVATCQKCHAGANANFAGYLAHATHHDRKKYPLVFWSFWAMTGLLVGVFVFGGIHTFMWLPRSWRLRQELKAEEMAEKIKDAARTPEAPDSSSPREEP
jgi:predicted CXXCH cytochrome family protein